MLKKIPEKYKLLTGIILILLVYGIAGILLFQSLKRTYRSDNINRITNKLNLTENFLFEQYSQNNQNILFSERLIKDILENRNAIQIDSSKSLKITAQKKHQSFTKKFILPHVTFSGQSAISFVESQLYKTNTFCEIWQKKGNNFVRIASGKPGDKNNYIFTEITEEPAKTIITGSAYTENLQAESELMFIKYFPVYYSGKVRFFISLQSNKNFLSSLSILFNKENENIIILNKDEKIIYNLNNGSSLPKEFNLQNNYSIISENINTKTIKDKTLYFKYIPELSVYITTLGSVKDFDVITGKTKQKIFLLILSLFALSTALFILIFYLNKKKENENLTGLAAILPSPDKDQKSLKEAVDSLKGYFSKISEITDNIAKQQYETEINENYKNEKLFQDFSIIRNSFIEKREKEQQQIQENEYKEKFDKAALEISEILQYASNVEDLSFKVIKQISLFTGAEQIALFVVNEDLQKGKSLVMTAGYAYSKQRSVHKELNTNDGLIGMVYLEKKPFFLTEIPENYTFIESGFGFQKPKCLFLFPLIFNNDVQAIIELGSINILEEEQINFLTRISENIASTIANLKHSKQTEILLSQTTKQSEEIELQRKTLEEKINTHRKQNRNLDKQILQLIEIIDSIKSVSYLIEYDLNGNIMDVSSKIVNLFEAEKNDFISKSHKDIIIDTEYVSAYKTFWAELAKNKIQYIDEVLHVGNNKYKLKQTYVPIKNVRRKTYRILSIGTIIE